MTGIKLKLSMQARHVAEAYSFIGLWIVGFFAFLAVPIARSLYYSFHELQVTPDGLVATFTGMSNYRTAFTTDVNFVPALLKTVGIMLLQVPLILVFAMFAALLMNRHMRGRMLFRAIFFLPVIITSGAILERLQQLEALALPMTESDGLDILYKMLPEGLVIPVMQSLDSLSLVMWGAGVQIVIFIAALQTIPSSLYEAAKCDGATPWESYWKITFPMIVPMVLVNTLFSMMESFTHMNNEVLAYIFGVTFERIQFGYASALGWIYFVCMFVAIVLVLYLFRGGKRDEGRMSERRG
ncbi:carbohydrate ABC transporter permease [Paenibacillus chungangensis]|uniref:Carbohydrate ABC transporter permease n=1 Tax=Paenibacillus chungangensis TaxID=696535 RepID=A0ABW3HXA4_9BACL